MLLKNERGSVLILALIVLVVGAMVGVALLTVGVNEDIRVSAAEKNLQAYYVARAAADAIAEFIVTDYEAADDMGIFSATVGSPVITDPNVPIEFADGTATAEIYVINESGEDRVVIEAFSEYGTDFIGHAILILDNREYFGEYALWSKDSIDGAHFTIGVEPGDEKVKVGSNGEIINSPDKIDPMPGDTEVLKDGVGEWFDEPELPTGLLSYPTVDLVINNGDEITLDSSYEIGALEIKNGGKLILDTGSGNIIEILLLEDSILKSNVEIVGTGSLKLYVSENKKIDIQTPISANSEAEDFTIYLASGSELEFTANGEVFAYIYGPSAKVIFGSSQTTFHGGIISGEFEATGNPDIIYDKPSSDYDPDLPPGVQRGEWRD